MGSVRSVAMAGDDFCYLATTGRRTGNPHEIEIWYARQGDTLYLLAGAGRSSDWVANLAAEPRCTVRIGADTHDAIGRLLDGQAGEVDAVEESRARTLVFDKYQPRYSGSLEDWRERSLPVAIDLRT